jgi:hypothetical protein
LTLIWPRIFDWRNVVAGAASPGSILISTATKLILPDMVDSGILAYSKGAGFGDGRLCVKMVIREQVFLNGQDSYLIRALVIA